MGGPPPEAVPSDQNTAVEGTPVATDSPPDAAPEPTIASGDGGLFVATRAEPVAMRPFDSDLMHVELSNRGAGITQVALKKFSHRANDDLGDPANWVRLFPDDEAGVQALSMRELAANKAPVVRLDEVWWEVARDEDVAGVRTVVFRHQDRDGLVIEKELRFTPGSYAVDVTVRTSALDSERAMSDRDYLVLGSGAMRDLPRGWFTDQVGAPAAVALRNAKKGDAEVIRKSADDLAGQAEVVTPVAWTGGANLYFLALLEPRGVEPATCSAELTGVGKDAKERVRAELRLTLPFADDGVVSSTALRYYVGPKDPVTLEQQGLSSLMPMIEADYGWSFHWVNVMLLAGLRLFHGFLGNWGLAIILLTLLVRVCVFPVTRMQQVSMQRYSQKMQVLKPKLDKLREKYKANPQKFAQEQAKLLKEHGAMPPVFGCLSMFITFPVFVGMFQILRTAFELRQAPFLGWIKDLSLPDAMFRISTLSFEFNLLPILATVAFVVQMKLAPKPDDPQAQQQQKMMTVMPVIFGVMFYGYAAGLSLYMLTTSMFSIFETQIIRKRFFPTPASTSKVVAVS